MNARHVPIYAETRDVGDKDLLNCEAGNLNTIETTLTSFNETNFFSLIVPEINVSCWDLVSETHPCTEDWLAR